MVIDALGPVLKNLAKIIKEFGRQRSVLENNE